MGSGRGGEGRVSGRVGQELGEVGGEGAKGKWEVVGGQGKREGKGEGGKV